MKLWQHLNQYINKENVVRLFSFVVFTVDRRKFNLTGGFFYFSFIVTGKETKFICSAVITYVCVKGGKNVGFQKIFCLHYMNDLLFWIFS